MDKGLIAVIILWTVLFTGIGAYAGMRWERLGWQQLVPREMDRVCNECIEAAKSNGQ